MSDASTSNEVSLYDNGEPVTTFCPIIINERLIGKVNSDGTSAAIDVDEASAASITPEDLKRGGVVTLLVGIVPPGKVDAIKSKISENARKSGGIGLDEGGVVGYLKERTEKETEKETGKETGHERN